MMTEIEDVNRLTGQDVTSKQKQRHVGSAPRPVYGKEPQAGGRQPVQMAVGVGHQLIGFLGRGVQADRMIHIVMHRKRHLGIGAIHRTGRGVDQMLDRVMTAGFQDIHEADQVGIHVGMGILQRIAHPGLRRQIDHPLGLVLGKNLGQRRPIFQTGPKVGKAGMRLQPGQPRLFQGHVVIIVEVVVADDLIAALQQPQRQGRADKACAAGNQDFHKRPSTAAAGNR